MLAAPNSGLLNQLWRLLTGAPADEALFDIYTLGGLIFAIACYTFPVCVHPGRQCARPHAGRARGCVLDAGRAHVGDGAAHHHPAALPTLLAGALVAFLQALNQFGSPAILAIPAGFHTLTTKIWSLFQFPPKPELAAATSLPLLLLTVALLRSQAAILGRRSYAVLGGKYGAPRLDPARHLAVGGGGAGAAGARHAALPALRGADQHRLQPHLLAAPVARDLHPAQRGVHLLATQLDHAGAQEHLPAGDRDGDPGRPAGAADRLYRGATGDGRAPAARLPRHVAARHPRHRAGRRACSSPTRGRRSRSTARCGSC
jgi:hypothetical protein